MMLYFKNPYALYLCIPAVIILLALLRRTFIKFSRADEKASYHSSNKAQRILIALMRSLVLCLLFIAFSYPFILEESVSEGNPHATILVDNSSSFMIFDQAIAQDLKARIEQDIPVSLRYFSNGESSAIGDAIVSSLRPDDNILLITDGHSNKGIGLGDAMMLASGLNTTISALRMEPTESDLIVSVTGPSQAIYGTPAEFYIDVENIGPQQLEYELTVMLNENIVIRESARGTKRFSLRRYLETGHHKIKAEIKADDFFSQNNQYHKTLEVLPKPKILFVSDRSTSTMQTISYVYDITHTSALPSSLDQYTAIVIHNKNSAWLDTNIDQLSSFVSEGNGLFVIGGDNSFDMGGYHQSVSETLLPVRVDLSTEEEQDADVLFVFDIYGSQSADIDLDSEVEQILKEIKPYRNIGVVGVYIDEQTGQVRVLAVEGFRTAEAERIEIPEEEEESDLRHLSITNHRHFITSGLTLDARISGYNRVVSKPAATVLVSTRDRKPVLTAWRFGLGRVAALTTDPEKWAGELLKRENSELITRTINWAVGNPGRKKDIDVRVSDSRVGDIASVYVMSEKRPVLEGYSFSMTGSSLYTAAFVPEEPGFKRFYDSVMAVSYSTEYSKLGLNPGLAGYVSMTGGRIFSKDQPEEIVEFIKSNSVRRKFREKSFSQYFLLAALLIFLLELCIRRVIENKKSIYIR